MNALARRIDRRAGRRTLAMLIMAIDLEDIIERAS